MTTITKYYEVRSNTKGKSGMDSPFDATFIRTFKTADGKLKISRIYGINAVMSSEIIDVPFDNTLIKCTSSSVTPTGKLIRIQTYNADKEYLGDNLAYHELIDGYYYCLTNRTDSVRVSGNIRVELNILYTLPTIEVKIDNMLKTYEKSWCKVDGKLREIDKIWTKVDGVLKEV